MLSYFVEIRRRALITGCVFLSFFMICFYFSELLCFILLKPLPKTLSVIATDITSPIMIPLKLALNTTCILIIPIIITQLWHFLMPALYHKERHYLIFFISSSLLLFSAGILFCYYFVLPLMFTLFARVGLSHVNYFPDIHSVFSFSTHMLLIFGLAFELPVVLIGSVTFGWISIEQLCALRPYAIVMAFIIGMILTPPDVMSQLMLAIPLCLLFEISVIGAKWMQSLIHK